MSRADLLLKNCFRTLDPSSRAFAIFGLRCSLALRLFYSQPMPMQKPTNGRARGFDARWTSSIGRSSGLTSPRTHALSHSPSTEAFCQIHVPSGRDKGTRTVIMLFTKRDGTPKYRAASWSLFPSFENAMTRTRNAAWLRRGLFHGQGGDDKSS